MEEAVLAYLRVKMPEARDLKLADFTQMTGGWSHQIYVFNAGWNENGRATTRRHVPAQGPGGWTASRAFLSEAAVSSASSS